MGVKASAGWTAPSGWLVLDVSATCQSFRNTAAAGPFAPYRGDRIPNRPWLFGNVALRVQQQGAFVARDEIALAGYLRYVHEFFRGWESVGLVEYKQVVPGYLVPSAGIVYGVEGQHATFTSPIEMHDITNARIENFYGVKRPGRTVHAKMTVEY